MLRSRACDPLAGSMWDPVGFDLAPRSPKAITCLTIPDAWVLQSEQIQLEPNLATPTQSFSRAILGMGITMTRQLLRAPRNGHLR